MAPVTQDAKKDIRIYSMVFSNAPLAEVIKALIRDSGLNVSIESEIDLARPITVQLEKVTFEEALDMVIVRGAGYAWQLDGDNLFLQKFQERIYKLDYLDIPGETDIEVGGDMLASGVESAGVSGKYQVKAARTKEFTDVWKSIEESLKELKSEDGALRINRNSGIIYMADTPKRIASMVLFLDSLMESLHRQVFIEAKILEVSLSENNQYGIDWTKLDIGFTSNSGVFPDQFGLSFNSGGTIVLDNATRFGAVLDYLQRQGDVTVVSNPHLTVMNGQSALMTVGFQFPYGDVDGVDRDADTGVVTYGVSIKRAILGLQLGITPHISHDGMVTLNIVPTITRIQGSERVEIPTSGTTTNSITNPIIDLQELSTTVRVREGHSVVLAGLISQIRQASHEGLPWLSQIPILKYFFKHIEEKNENRELVIFITPHVRKEG
jgi:MSHA type pilus biogenesis protein MshL